MTNLNQPSLSKLQQLVKYQEDRSYETYKARINTANRLRLREYAWNTALISTSTASTASGIAMLVEGDIYGDKGPVNLAIIAVMTLVVSLVVTSHNYHSRREKMDHNYRKIQSISLEFEFLRCQETISSEKYHEILERYQQALGESDNHTDADYLKYKRQESKRNGNSISPSMRSFFVLSGDFVVTFTPFASLIIPAYILFPVFEMMI